MLVKDLDDWLGKGQGRLRAARCKGCGATVAQGHTPPPGSWFVTLDPVALTATGEAHALLEDRGTFTVVRTWGNRIKITSRSIWRTRPREPFDIWAEHRCHHPPTHTRETRVAPIRTVTADTQAPF